MVTKKKSSQLTVYSGSPWEIASIVRLLNAAYINDTYIEDGAQEVHLSVSSEHYSAAVRLIGNRH